MKDKKIVIIGAGGIGLYFGGRMAQKGLNVHFLARGETKKMLQEQGLKVESINGDFTLNKVNVIKNPDSFGKADLVLVCVKTNQLKGITDQIKPLIGPSTVVLPLENGIEAPTILANELGEGPVIGGLCMIRSFKVGPNLIKHVAIDPTITFGELHKPITDRIKEIKALFDYAGIKSNPHDEFLVPYWTKLTFISTLSGVGAITRKSVGEYRNIPETRQLIKQAIDEIIKVAQKSGVTLPKETAENTLKTLDSLPGHTMASMQRDIMNGNPSELYEQNGTIYRLGKELGVDTPVNTFIFSSLLPSELEARNKITK